MGDVDCIVQVYSIVHMVDGTAGSAREDVRQVMLTVEKAELVALNWLLVQGQPKPTTTCHDLF